MNKIFLLFLAVCMLSSYAIAKKKPVRHHRTKTVRVKGHTKKNGNYSSHYYRSQKTKRLYK